MNNPPESYRVQDACQNCAHGRSLCDLCDSGYDFYRICFLGVGEEDIPAYADDEHDNRIVDGFGKCDEWEEEK